MKIVYLPLDERPCNLQYPQRLAAMTDIDLIAPETSILGLKKKSAEYEMLKKWLIEKTVDADYLIISIDMLVYGGIVPSRLHYYNYEEAKQRLELLKELKESNKNLKINAFNLIMRTPSYNNDDEEPDYYAEYGERISNYGKLFDKKERQDIIDSELEQLSELEKEMPEEVLGDFISRRKINAEINKLSIQFASEELIDRLIIPLDDNATYGFSPREQRLLMHRVAELNLYDRVLIYPGADEVGATLFSKVFCEIKDYHPSLYLRYSSTKGPFIIPPFEDRSLGESLKYQITAAGGMAADNSTESEAVLMVHSPATEQECIGSTSQAILDRHPSYFSEVNYLEFITRLKHYLNQGKVIGLADVALTNGSDVVLMNLLAKYKLIDKLQAYAGWNTSGNTLGTVIAHTIIESYYHEDRSGELKQASRDFFYERLIEDWGYQANVRFDIATNDLERLEGNYFDISKHIDEAENTIRKQLQQFIDHNIAPYTKEQVNLVDVYSPWKRLFEVGIKVST